ncbi:PD-(D/E)XK nuclease family protein [Natrinema zhouii]|uniref:PD-(D/E)XK nuclease family protein n=1 Tax=Natrinema zhouii TaxID=1710539 RepID=A0A7D6GV74_9EURY|nr:PD-(D/E)XK nuclease family protein [Natrinema zhouii]QLK25546.1 PD-(D/E)XK nuclease family protein [Natrinema zhouii]
MAQTTSDSTLPDRQQSSEPAEELLDLLSPQQFREWYQDRQWRKNIENGQPYFNGPGSIPDPERHSPSQLLQCHRKLVYRQENAPAEQPDPRGIFWFGTRFEEDLLFPFLNRAVTGTDTYVQNSIWIDFTVQSDAGELRIKGATDPVIVDSDATPILPTEVKTKSSVDSIREPNRHHRAQVHAYLVGLSKKFEQDFTDAVLVYGGREALELKTFHVEFDAEFWDEVVVDWAEQHTQYRVDGELPPADPEYDWECRFCSYRTRCGKGDTDHRDVDPNGLLVGYGGYPLSAVIEYLDDNPDESLTPTLAKKFPKLVEEYGVVNWFCQRCSSEIGWDKVDPQGSPICPLCADQDEISSLSLASGEL